jgi:cyclopropane fatty-acyl-phospholipid synthase-like methyltransferase
MTPETVSYRGRTKYDEATARRYQVRKAGKHRAELRLVDRAFARIPTVHRVLDVPCGGGRVALHLAQKGYGVTCADLSEAMRTIARGNLEQAGVAGAVDAQDVERLTYPDRAFDTVVSFRLFHHFPTAEIRGRVVRELCRVAGQYVALSYFSPASVTSVKRKLRGVLGGRSSQKYATTLAEVAGYFEAAGFRLVQDFAQLPLVHTLHLALFERRGSQGG